MLVCVIQYTQSIYLNWFVAAALLSRWHTRRRNEYSLQMNYGSCCDRFLHVIQTLPVAELWLKFPQVEKHLVFILIWSLYSCLRSDPASWPFAQGFSIEMITHKLMTQSRTFRVQSKNFSPRMLGTEQTARDSCVCRLIYDARIIWNEVRVASHGARLTDLLHAIVVLSNVIDVSPNSS